MIVYKNKFVYKFVELSGLIHESSNLLFDLILSYKYYKAYILWYIKSELYL